MTLLVAGPGGRALADALADRLGATAAASEFKTFPDGEVYARITTPVREQDVAVVETGYPPSRFWTLLLLLNAARENGATRVRAVVPYLPYARQDRVFMDGEALSAKLVAETLSAHADEVVTVELHKEDVARFFRVPCRHVSANEAFAREFRARGVQVVLAPDAGARARAEAVAAGLGAAVDHLEKKRLSATEVEIKPKSLDVRGKVVAIVDDIISTGGTMAVACGELVRQGAARVVCAGVHGLFIGDAAEKLKKAGAAEILATDTIPSAYSRVSVADAIAQALGARSASARVAR